MNKIVRLKASQRIPTHMMFNCDVCGEIYRVNTWMGDEKITLEFHKEGENCPGAVSLMGFLPEPS